jgi:hypothetical protein
MRIYVCLAVACALFCSGTAFAAGDSWAKQADKARGAAKQQALALERGTKPTTAQQLYERLAAVEKVEAALGVRLVAIRSPRSAADDALVNAVRDDLRELDAAVTAFAAGDRTKFARLYKIWSDDKRVTAAARAAGALGCANG